LVAYQHVGHVRAWPRRITTSASVCAIRKRPCRNGRCGGGRAARHSGGR
jgi:hypothetical protein